MTERLLIGRNCSTPVGLTANGRAQNRHPEYPDPHELHIFLNDDSYAVELVGEHLRPRDGTPRPLKDTTNPAPPTGFEPVLPP